MDGQTILLSVVSLLIGGLVTWWFARRYAAPKRRLSLDYSIARVGIPRAARDAISVFHRDNRVDDPHFVRLVVKNVGDADIPGSAFTDGTFEIDLGSAKYVALIDSPSDIWPAAISQPDVPDQTKIVVRGDLLKAGEDAKFMWLSSGRPKIGIICRATDVSIETPELRYLALKGRTSLATKLAFANGFGSVACILFVIWYPEGLRGRALLMPLLLAGIFAVSFVIYRAYSVMTKFKPRAPKD